MSENKNPKIIAVSISEKKGEKKKNMNKIELKEDFGIIGDAHAGTKDRQVSLLAGESIDKMKEKGLDVKSGDFAENITTEGIDLPHLPIGTTLAVGEKVILEVTQIGKECHTACAIRRQVGDCIMPAEGIFARVVRGGPIKAGDSIKTGEISQ